MPQSEDVTIKLTGIRLTDTGSGQPVELAQVAGVQVLVLLRHRH